MEWKDTTVDILEQRSEIYTVWLCDTNRIASFHSVTGYEPHSFTCHEFFMGFLHSLQERGYRFQ